MFLKILRVNKFKMEILTNLTNLGFNTNVTEKDFAAGSPNFKFFEIVTLLSSQLVALCKLESHVNSVTDEGDYLGFLVEVSSFLKELRCPYKNLTTSSITERLITPADKKLLILYLCTELEAAKIQALKKPRKEETAAPMQIELDESETAKELREMLICLRFPKPRETISNQQLFGEIEKKLNLLSQPSTPKEKIGELLFSGYLTEKQWFQIEKLYKEFYQEYKNRKNLLLARLDVTVKSFLWADRLKPKADEILNLYDERKNSITAEPRVKISHVLAAKADLAVVAKTSSASVLKNTKSSVVKHVIGPVPDRGGRLGEQQPPLPEVPSWQINVSSFRGGMGQSIAQPTLTGNSGYSRDNIGHSRDNIGHSRNNRGYSTDNSGYSRENTSRDNIGYRNASYVRDDNFDPHLPIHNYNKRGNIFQSSGVRNNHIATAVYQSENYCTQLGNPPFGFPGYMRAGDNYQMYGIEDGVNQMKRGRGESRESGYRIRGGYDRGSSRGSRGGRRGRNLN